jgi:hypothetical protein
VDVEIDVQVRGVGARPHVRERVRECRVVHAVAEPLHGDVNDPGAAQVVAFAGLDVVPSRKPISAVSGVQKSA